MLGEQLGKLTPAGRRMGRDELLNETYIRVGDRPMPIGKLSSHEQQRNRVRNGTQVFSAAGKESRT